MVLLDLRDTIAKMVARITNSSERRITAELSRVAHRYEQTFGGFMNTGHGSQFRIRLEKSIRLDRDTLEKMPYGPAFETAEERLREFNRTLNKGEKKFQEFAPEKKDESLFDLPDLEPDLIDLRLKDIEHEDARRAAKEISQKICDNVLPAFSTLIQLSQNVEKVMSSWDERYYKRHQDELPKLFGELAEKMERPLKTIEQQTWSILGITRRWKLKGAAHVRSVWK